VAGSYSKNTALVQRFGKALWQLATAQNQADIIDAELRQLAASLAASPDLQSLIQSPLFRREQQQRALDTILATANASPLLRQFIGTLAMAKRLPLLPEIAADFSRRLSESRGEIIAELRSAHPLSADQERGLQRQLGAMLGDKKIILQTQIDPSLLGGLSVRIGSQLWDASLRSKLNGLQLVLQQAA
jgi:F-type H+-transporting ATPase subunit delta